MGTINYVNQCGNLIHILSIQVVCKLIPTTPSGTVIAPLYGIIAPTHDFTAYNQDRASSGLSVRVQVFLYTYSHAKLDPLMMFT